MVAPAPRKGPPPKANGNGSAPVAAPEGASSVDRFAVQTGVVALPQKVVIYGPGGIGKSSLARLAPNPIFLDIEGRTNRLDVPRLQGIESWDDLRSVLQSNRLDAYQTIVIDSVTKAEEMAVEWTLKNVKTEKQTTPTSIEGYGFGKGYQHVYDTFLKLLMDLDRQVRGGRNVVLVAHVCTAKVPNPKGEDFIRYEPRLQQTKEGKASIRNRIVEWADHVLFVGYDVNSEEGKGTGAGTRSIFTKEMPTHIAKVREMGDAVSDQLDYANKDDGSVWPMILLGTTGGVS